MGIRIYSLGNPENKDLKLRRTTDQTPRAIHHRAVAGAGRSEEDKFFARPAEDSADKTIRGGYVYVARYCVRAEKKKKNPKEEKKKKPKEEKR